jgi:hypothetical protein
MRLPIYPLSHRTTPSRFALWRGTMLGDVILKLCKTAVRLRPAPQRLASFWVVRQYVFTLT